MWTASWQGPHGIPLPPPRQHRWQQKSRQLRSLRFKQAHENERGTIRNPFLPTCYTSHSFWSDNQKCNQMKLIWLSFHSFQKQTRFPRGSDSHHNCKGRKSSHVHFRGQLQKKSQVFNTPLKRFCTHFQKKSFELEFEKWSLGRALPYNLDWNLLAVATKIE